MKRLHVVSDRNPCNGMFVAARMMSAHEDGSRVMTCAEFLTTDYADYTDYEEVVVHGCWLPCYWRCCLKVLRHGNVQPPTPRMAPSSELASPGGCSNLRPLLARMTHASLDPVRLAHHGWKKRLVAPIERWLFRRCDRILVTCEAEKNWIREYLDGRSHESKSKRGDRFHSSTSTSNFNSKIQITDLKRFFKLDTPIVRPKAERHLEALHVLYLGRRHPLKGVEYLEKAVRELNDTWHKYHPHTPLPIELKIVSNAFGDEKEKVWSWCDVLCLPTLSDNLGLVIAEAIEHGRSVVTTDGAPAWSDFKPRIAADLHGFVYLNGYRDGTERQRIDLLKDALKQFPLYTLHPLPLCFSVLI